MGGGFENQQMYSVHKLFEREVERDPGRIAIVCGDERLTYVELNLRSNRIAHHLLSLGLEQEAFIAILMQRSPNMIAALLGILKASCSRPSDRR